MLFNSFDFLLVFLPITMAGFFVLGRFGRLNVALVWLAACSLFFHGYTRASFTSILITSIIFNYAIAQFCGRTILHDEKLRRLALIVGIACNIGLLGYFKYAGFLSSTFWNLTGYYFNVGNIALPLAISFYTFQQIAFIVDVYNDKAKPYTFLQYVSYLAFFPHLIAGPIVRHDVLIRQLSCPNILTPRATNIAVGISIIMIGLFKKVVLADGAAIYVDPIFDAATTGATIGFAEAWLGALLFSFVIYFDFSGYSDIAVGLALIFNVRFPENFSSPYKAANIIEFWRRWHITLSAFLRDYLYIPLGGRKKNHYRNILIVMLLGGLWHGAGWTFVLWGGLHGCYLVIAHFWRSRRPSNDLPGSIGTAVARAGTYLAVVIAWVLFRSSSLDQALNIYTGMAGLQGISSNLLLPPGPADNFFSSACGLAIILLLFVNALPNTQQIMMLFRPVLYSISRSATGWSRALLWRFSLPHVALVCLFGMYAMTRIETAQTFIYFRF